MAFILSPKITPDTPGMWGEGAAYEKKSIYSIAAGKLPPVNYDEHVIRSHSLTHFETPSHTIQDGKRLDHYYKNPHYFYGRTVVVRLSGNKYEDKGNGIYHWIISKEELENKLNAIQSKEIPGKILVTTDSYPLNKEGYHDPNYVLTLSQEAADYLVSLPHFELYGTSWKSSDFNPGQPGRPIHNTIFKRAGILENLDLINVPEGIYFMTAFPLPIENASESPVVPVLFTKEEILSSF